MSDCHAKSTVLLVEDEMLVRLHGMDVLEDAGFTVLEAGNADEAVAVLRDHREVTLLFSDIDMPGSMNGLQLARWVHDRWPAIRLLLTSGQQQLTAQDIPDDGRFLRKPWAQEALIANIRQMLP